mmetsp:Transcript_63137/g.100361  ORF Transcript_63137/g.100361 Transcript_63137/m.100361 type:complete len:407 (-) Transcript_63137:55-1275(-)
MGCSNRCQQLFYRYKCCAYPHRCDHKFTNPCTDYFVTNSSTNHSSPHQPPTTRAPTNPTPSPTSRPSAFPSQPPSKDPSAFPSSFPSATPSRAPSDTTANPTGLRTTSHPSTSPTVRPPSDSLSARQPTMSPTDRDGSVIETASTTTESPDSLSDDEGDTNPHGLFLSTDTIFMIIVIAAFICVCIVCTFLCFKIGRRNKSAVSAQTPKQAKPEISGKRVKMPSFSNLANDVDSNASVPPFPFVVEPKEMAVLNANMPLKKAVNNPGKTKGNNARKEDVFASTAGKRQNDDVLKRNHDEIREWLTKQVGSVYYYDAFVSNGYDSLQFIKEIQSKEELDEIGITGQYQQEILLREIEKLRRVNNNASVAGVNGRDVMGMTGGDEQNKHGNTDEFVVYGDDENTDIYH